MDFSMQSNTTRQIWSSVADALLGSIATALLTLVCYRLQADAATVALLYLVIVVMVSLRGDLVASVWVSLLAVAALDYFLTPPLFRLTISAPLDIVALIAFLTTALVINRLIFRMRRSSREVEVAHDQLRLVIDTVPILLTSTGPDGAVEFVNQQWRDFLGLSLEEVQGWGWTGALHPDDQGRFVGEWRAALASGVPLESEARMRRADGEYRWLLIRVVPLRDQHGHIVRWYGTSTDIEDRKRAEARVRQADRERRLVIDSIPALVWSSFPDGSSDFNNQRWLEYTGLSEEEARDWGYKSGIHPEDYQRLVAEWAAHFASGDPIEHEARLRRSDGQYRWFLHRAVPLRDERGNIVKWYGTSTDIDDLKRAENVLSDNAELLDLTHDTVFVRDMSDAITYWNRGAATLYGWSRDEAVGNSSHQLMQTIFPAPLDEINEELLRTGRWEGELVHTKRDGTQVVVASRWSLQRDESGRPAAILETNNDVTERQRAEAGLRESEARYRHIFQTAGVSLWEEDFSGVKAAIDGLKAQGVTDFREYLATHPEFVLQAISLVKIIDVNDTTLTLLQARSKGELLVSLHTVFTPETQEVFAGELIAIAEGRTTFEAESVLQTMEGNRLSVFFTIVFPAESPTLDSVLMSIMDITERKKAEDALRRSEAYLAEAQRMSHTGSWAHDVRNPEQGYRSAETSRIHGLEPDDPVSGSLQDVLDRMHPDDRGRVVEARQRAIREKTDFEVDYRLLLADGSTRYIHSVGHPIVDPSGEVVELVGTVMDVTDRKRAERALRRARERTLEARFAAVLDERTRLARDIHDTLLQGFTGIALKLVAAIHRVTEPVESVVALRNLVGLTQQTLTDARRAVWDLRSPALAGGDLPVALRTAAEDCVRGTTLELEYDTGGAPRPVDPDVGAAVVRVAQEAITNAVKHADARTVRVRLSFEARRVRLSVSDDGRGFAVAPDFHAYGGHWGLLGMRERASQVRGKLSLRSTPGHGTELVLLVPYIVKQAAPAAGPASSSTS
jgi:PAS domain S-box-containing protein